jgi:hypothetical protein
MAEESVREVIKGVKYWLSYFSSNLKAGNERSQAKVLVGILVGMNARCSSAVNAAFASLALRLYSINSFFTAFLFKGNDKSFVQIVVCLSAPKHVEQFTPLWVIDK